MSKCISSHGEYSEHEGIGDYCDWCGDCNHAAIRRNAKIEALREAAEDSGLIDYMYKYFAHPHLHAPPTVRAVSSYLHDRADQEDSISD